MILMCFSFLYGKRNIATCEGIYACANKLGNIESKLFDSELDIITGYSIPVAVCIVRTYYKSNIVRSCVTWLADRRVLVVSIVVNNSYSVFYIDQIIFMTIRCNLCRCAVSYRSAKGPTAGNNVVYFGSCSGNGVCAFAVCTIFPLIVGVCNCKCYSIFAFIDTIFIFIFNSINFLVFRCCGAEDITVKYGCCFRKLGNGNRLFSNFESEWSGFYSFPVICFICVNNCFYEVCSDIFRNCSCKYCRIVYCSIEIYYFTEISYVCCCICLFRYKVKSIVINKGA